MHDLHFHMILKVGMQMASHDERIILGNWKIYFKENIFQTYK